MTLIEETPEILAQVKVAHRINETMQKMGHEHWELGPVASRGLVIKLRDAVTELNQRLTERANAMMELDGKLHRRIRELEADNELLRRSLGSHGQETYDYLRRK